MHTLFISQLLGDEGALYIVIRVIVQISSILNSNKISSQTQRNFLTMLFWLVWQEPHSTIPWLCLCLIISLGRLFKECENQHHTKICRYIFSVQYCIRSVRRRKVCVLYMAFIQLYIEHRSRKDYVIQENAWSSSRSASQRMNQATFELFFRYISKSINIVTNFHTSDDN